MQSEAAGFARSASARFHKIDLCDLAYPVTWRSEFQWTTTLLQQLQSGPAATCNMERDAASPTVLLPASRVLTILTCVPVSAHALRIGLRLLSRKAGVGRTLISECLCVASLAGAKMMSSNKKMMSSNKKMTPVRRLKYRSHFLRKIRRSNSLHPSTRDGVTR